MDSRYNPSEFEESVLTLWSDLFKADNKSDKPPFVVMMPPPNITGQLHMGHALNNSLQDSIVRYKRMNGFNVLWLPGVDHASIATELKIVEALTSQGKTKQDVGREKFIELAYAWKAQYGGKICSQLKRLGCSVDWSRESFTMDEQCSKAVKTAFVNLYDKGLIYQGDKIINWCVQCKTALSDAEVEHALHDGTLWHIKYSIDDSSFIVVATTRPETMLGDVAIAVNPNDSRYKDCIGKFVKLPLTDKKIPIIADNYVEKNFGTGAVKITPAHDANDFEVGLRHDLKPITVISDDGKMIAEGYTDVDRFEARKQILQKLKEQDLLLKIEPHSHNVGHCYRCDSVVEPLLSRQWFVKMEPLAKPAIDKVAKNEVTFIPKSYTKIYMHWMNNIKDWCISRQLWWGHRIPCYQCVLCGDLTVSAQSVTSCKVCGGSVTQDEACLDTWFSSALWPFSTLGFPDKTDDLKAFYPGSVLVTAYDIIFFWVARMIFSGLYHMGSVPFEKVLIHGIVRDEQGRKMSKSLGNGVDPIKIIDEYGTDSLRFCLLSGVALGSDIRYSTQKLQRAQAFINKLWNASRFVLLKLEGVALCDFDEIKTIQLSVADRWILTRLNQTVQKIHKNFDKFELGRVADCLYDFVWDDFCDWYIEIAKTQLQENKQIAASVLSYLLQNILIILHPIIPFVTEYLHSQFCTHQVLAVKNFPKKIKEFKKDAQQFENVKQLIVATRILRADNGIAQNVKSTVFVEGKQQYSKVLQSCKLLVQKLTFSDSVTMGVPSGENYVKWSGEIGTAYLQLQKIDIETINKKLVQNLQLAQKELSLAKSKLNSQGFMSKAPLKLVQAEQEKVEKYSKIIQSIETQMVKNYGQK